MDFDPWAKILSLHKNPTRTTDSQSIRVPTFFPSLLPSESVVSRPGNTTCWMKIQIGNLNILWNYIPFLLEDQL